jgi:hypothetical protein
VLTLFVFSCLLLFLFVVFAILNPIVILIQNGQFLSCATIVLSERYEVAHTFMIISRWIFRMRNVSDKVVEKINLKNITCNTFFFRKSCRSWDNVEKYGRARQATDNIIRRMLFACRITKATRTHSWYVIRNLFSTATMLTRTRLIVTFLRVLPVLFILRSMAMFGIEPGTSLMRG